MSEIKRFDVAGCHSYCYGGYHMEECVDGDYVSSEDFDSVEAERDALRKDAARYRWLLQQSWIQDAFDRFDFTDGGMQKEFEKCADQMIDAALSKEQA